MSLALYEYKEKLFARLDIYQNKYPNNFKKLVFKMLFWHIKYLFKPHKTLKSKATFCDNFQHISITLAGGMGDLCIAAKYVEALYRYLGENVVFDIIAEVQDVALLQFLFKDKAYIQQVIPVKEATALYDLSLYLVRFPLVLNYFPQRLSAKTLSYVEHLVDFRKSYPLVCQNDFMGRCWSLLKGQKRENQADIEGILGMDRLKFKLPFPQNISEILLSYGICKPFITLQTGAGRHFENVANEARQWSLERYEELVEGLKKKYPEYQIVQLGQATQEKIKNADIDLRGKTGIEELFGILSSAKLHIAQESGMVIARHFLEGGKSVVLFGPTDEKFFGFDENVNLSMRKCPIPCEWLTKDWMRRCTKTGGEAECMKSLFVENVLSKIIISGVIQDV